MSAVLVMFTKGGERRDFEIHGEKAVIGRISECHIQIGLGVVSRKHCELTVQGKTLLVRDLGSSNGTYVNNRRVQQVEMSAGDTLTVGPVIFTLVVDGKPDQVKPIRTMIGKSSKKQGGGPKPAQLKEMPEKSNPLAKIEDDTGSIDLDDSAELEIFGGSSVAGENPLAELEELSKQKRSS